MGKYGIWNTTWISAADSFNLVHHASDAAVQQLYDAGETTARSVAATLDVASTLEGTLRTSSASEADMVKVIHVADQKKVFVWSM